MRKALVAIGLVAALLWLIRWQASPDSGDGGAFQAALERARTAQHGGAQVPSGQIIADGDLPPAGTRSLFDHHIARLGGVPYPFATLLASFDEGDRWNDGAVGLLIPHGRSLTKGQTSFRQPRVLAAARTRPPLDEQSLAPVYAGRLFLGFTEAADEIEVIAYNAAAGRFEFQLVQNYCRGCQPRLVYARRAVCLACHQAATPIFPVRPWTETNAHIPVARRIAEARGVSWSEASSRKYHGVPLSTQILMPESFDELVAAGAKLTLAQQLWLDGCGSDGLACRRQILAQALFLLMSPGEFHPDSSHNQQLRQYQATHWPKNGIAVADHSLRDRDPLADRTLLDALRRRLDALLLAAPSFPLFVGQDEAPLARKLARFARQPGLPAEFDPLRLRPPLQRLQPDSLAAVHHVASLFVPNDRVRLRQWSDDRPGTIRQLVLDGALDELLAAAPVSRVAVMQALARRLGRPAPPHCCRDASQLDPPQSESASVLPIPQDSALGLFQRYCFACHRGNPVQHLNFMGAPNLEELAADIRAKWQIRQRLDFARYEHGDRHSQLMPPPGSEQRRRLDAARRQGADHLQQMRDFVTPAPAR